MKHLKTWLIQLAFFAFVPLLGLTVSALVSKGFEKQHTEVVLELATEKGLTEQYQKNEILKRMSIENTCSRLAPDANGLRAFCQEYERSKLLGDWSLLTLKFSILALALIYIAGKIAQKQRIALFYLFRPGLLISQISSAALVVANAAILVYSIYLAEAFYIGRVHFGLIAALGLVSILAALSVCRKALTPIKSAEAFVVGKSISKDDQPQVWQFVESIAKQTATTPPQTIIVGMNPNFFVTEATVNCLDGKVKGKSLYLSLPFCRVIGKEELSAIIGHEMGHFVGNDTLWSKKFYPIYRGSIETLHTLQHSSDSESDNGIASLAFLPSMIFMNLFISVFEKAEKSIGRARELKADELGAKITSPSIMAQALLKTHMFIYAWHFTEKKMKEALSDGKQIINISTFFCGVSSHIPFERIKSDVESSSTSHPTDSHPPLSARLNDLGITLSELDKEDIKVNEDTAINLIANPSEIEEELSEIEHHKMARENGIRPPEREGSE